MVAQLPFGGVVVRDPQYRSRLPWWTILCKYRLRAVVPLDSHRNSAVEMRGHYIVVCSREWSRHVTPGDLWVGPSSVSATAVTVERSDPHEE